MGIRQRSKFMQQAMEVESDYTEHYDWCQALTRNSNVQVITKVLREKVDFHEVFALCFSQKGNGLSQESMKTAREIILERPETRYPVFLELKRAGLLLSYFIVRHDNAKTITGFLNNYCGENYASSFVEKYLIEAKGGNEKWMFISNRHVLYQLRNKIMGTNLGRVKEIGPEEVTEHKINMYYKIFKLFGADREESKILSLAKIYNLLDNPYDKELQNLVSIQSGIPSERLLPILDGGVMKCSWIQGAIKELRTRCYASTT